MKSNFIFKALYAPQQTKVLSRINIQHMAHKKLIPSKTTGNETGDKNSKMPKF